VYLYSCSLLLDRGRCELRSARRAPRASADLAAAALRCWLAGADAMRSPRPQQRRPAPRRCLLLRPRRRKAPIECLHSAALHSFSAPLAFPVQLAPKGLGCLLSPQAMDWPQIRSRNGVMLLLLLVASFSLPRCAAATDMQQKLVEFYKKHNPDAVASGKVDNILVKYAGKERALLEKAEKEYAELERLGISARFMCVLLCASVRAHFTNSPDRVLLGCLAQVATRNFMEMVCEGHAAPNGNDCCLRRGWTLHVGRSAMPGRSVLVDSNDGHCRRQAWAGSISGHL
jgi:hypothetical protein